MSESEEFIAAIKSGYALIRGASKSDSPVGVMPHWDDLTGQERDRYIGVASAAFTQLSALQEKWATRTSTTA